MHWVEDIEVSVLDPMVTEVGRGVSFCIKWGGIFSFSFAPCSDQVSFFISGVKTNILGNFWLVLLIKEDKGVMSGVTSIEEGPSFSRMHGVLKF